MRDITRFSIPSSDGRTALAAYCLMPEGEVRGAVQISHGMCEYFLRYEPFARALAAHGFAVFGHDHLGHGNTAPDAEGLGFTAEGGGVGYLIEDLHRLAEEMRRRCPTLPLILFGHSMGSFLARAVLTRYPDLYRAAVFCGTGGPETPAAAGRLLASLMMRCKGERYRSPTLAAIAFAGYNKKFEKGCDRNAWLTRDREVVARYNADPFCSYRFTLRAYHDLFSAVEEVSSRDWAGKLPPSLPVLVTSGEMDPVGGWGRGVRTVYERMRRAGMQNVTLRLYPDMRHEILNEIGKETVWTEIREWMEAQCR